MQTFTVELTRITWQSPDKSHTIAQASLDPEQPEGVNPKDWTNKRCKAIKGDIGPAQVGDILDVTGDFIEDRRFGNQFQVKLFVKSVANTDRAIVAFLKGFPQIGPGRARAIIDHFGGHVDAIEVMTNDHMRLTEIKGISPERAVEIHTAFMQAGGRRDAALFLGGFAHITERLAARILDKWGGDTKTVLTADPYAIMELRGVGFKKADAIASDLGIVGDDPRRCAAAAQYVLDVATGDGHTWSTMQDLVGDGASWQLQRALQEVGVTAVLIESGFVTLSKPRTVGDYVRDPAVVIDGDRFHPANLHYAEARIGTHVARLLGTVPA